MVRARGRGLFHRVTTEKEQGTKPRIRGAMGGHLLVIIELERPEQLTSQVWLGPGQRLDPEIHRAAVTHRDEGKTVVRPMGKEQFIGRLHDGVTGIEKLEARDADSDGQ